MFNDLDRFDIGDYFTGGVLFVFVVVALALAALFVIALVSIVGSPQLSAGEKTAWIALVLFLQLIGPLMWFAFGRRMGGSAASSRIPPAAGPSSW